MSYTYSQLKTAVQDYMQNDESTFVSNLNNFIENAEDRILKLVEIDNFRKNVTGAVTASNTYLAAPSDFLAPFSLALIDSSNNYNYLKFKHVSFIRDYTPAAATTGTPLYYALFDDNTFILAPTPNAAFSMELHYLYRPGSLTAAGDSGTTWISKNAPETILYGTLVEAAVFMKNFESVPLYEQRFLQSLDRLKNMAEGRRTRQEYRYDQLRREPT
jgi:hypothetical protein|tara:strand:- start:8 stop:655 length:648 start_codon:yes stop_codon:yes gene_type:complete